MLAYRLAMGWGWIAFVSVPVVGRIFFVEALHAVVSVGFCQDAGGSDTHVLGIAPHDGGVGEVVVGREAIAVHDDLLRAEFELVQGAVHGQDAGTKDVDAVYLLVRDDADSPSQSLTLDDLAEGIALALAELLGVVQQVVLEVGRQDDGGGIDRPRQTTSPSLVASGFKDVVMIEGQQHVGS